MTNEVNQSTWDLRIIFRKPFTNSVDVDHENHLILSISSTQDLPLFSGSHFSFVAERKKKKNLFA